MCVCRSLEVTVQSRLFRCLMNSRTPASFLVSLRIIPRSRPSMQHIPPPRRLASDGLSPRAVSLSFTLQEFFVFFVTWVSHLLVHFPTTVYGFHRHSAVRFATKHKVVTFEGWCCPCSSSQVVSAMLVILSCGGLFLYDGMGMIVCLNRWHALYTNLCAKMIMVMVMMMMTVCCGPSVSMKPAFGIGWRTGGGGGGEATS